MSYICLVFVVVLNFCFCKEFVYFDYAAYDFYHLIGLVKNLLFVFYCQVDVVFTAFVEYCIYSWFKVVVDFFREVFED